jgi:hypothetical protein
MAPPHDAELERVRALSPEERYYYFVDGVLRTQRVGILGDGSELAVADDPDEGVQYVGLWPDRRFADAERERSVWSRYDAAEVALDELMNKLLPSLQRDGVSVGVFPVWDRGAFVLGAEQLRAELEHAAASRPAT